VGRRGQQLGASLHVTLHSGPGAGEAWRASRSLRACLVWSVWWPAAVGGVNVARPLGAFVLRCGGRRGAGWVARVTVTWAGRQEGSLGVVAEASAGGTAFALIPWESCRASASLGTCVCACGLVRPRGMKAGIKHRGAGRGPDVIGRPPLGRESTWRVCVVEQLVCCRPSLALGREAGGPRVTSTHHCTPPQAVRRGDGDVLHDGSLPLEELTV
jgi:hypothetical protein